MFRMLPQLTVDLDQVNAIIDSIGVAPEFVYDRFNGEYPIENQLRWVSYDNSGEEEGHLLSFLHNIHLHHPEFVDEHLTKMRNLFIPEFSDFFVPEQVLFVRTRGRVKAHYDEKHVKSRIAVAIRNCNNTQTIFHYAKDRFFPLQCHDGRAVIFDAQITHSVMSDNPHDRYQLTYSLDIKWSEAIKGLR